MTTQTATRAFIIRNEQVIAIVNTTLKNGAEVQFSSQTCKEAINANREKNLVNAKRGKISRAKKWESKATYAEYATAINNGDEFVL